MLRDVSLRLERGDFSVLMGRSGTGKSTLLNLISGIDQPTSGRVRIGDTDLTDKSETERTRFRRAHIGFVFQSFNLISTLTVGENVRLPLELTGEASQANQDRARTMLDRVGLADRADQFPDHLSGGEQQRVAVARALAHEPLLVLADEPTGNLDYETGQAVPDSSPSDWRTNQVYMAHFAVTNGANKEFHAFERFQRGGAGLAGAQAPPFRVWLDDCSMTGSDTSAFPLRLRAHQKGLGIDLSLRPTKPRVLQGNQGLSQKGPGSGNASYYYSYTRLATEGTLILSGDTLSVNGQSWMDREWSTSALGPNQEGWDWFSLQLDDGRDLMYYQLRRMDGSPSRFSEGMIVGLEGSTQTLDRSDVTIEVIDTWTSSDGTHTYPVEWSLQVPGENIALHITPYVPDQELDVSVRYWEGAVRVEGSATGRGYVEMTGYGDSAGSPIS